MFTRPKPTRPEPVRATPSPRAAMPTARASQPQTQAKAPNQQHAAERELRRLLNTLRPQPSPPVQAARPAAHTHARTAPRTNPPPQAVTPPLLQAQRQPTSTPQAQTAAPQPQPIQTQASTPPTTRLRPHLLPLWVSVGGLALVALAAAFLSLVADGSSTASKKLLQAMEPRLAKVEATQTQHNAHMQAMAALLQATAQEIKHPPPTYIDAELAFKHQRYLEAENGFNRYAQENPGGYLLDKALFNAAVAAAMRGECQMAASHLARLKKQYPKAYLLEARQLTNSCPQEAHLRRQRQAQAVGG